MYLMLNSERLYIRSMLAADWLDVKGLFEDFRQSPYHIYDAPLPESDEDVRLLTWRFAQSELFFAVFEKNKPELIGYVCFRRQDSGAYDLGYCFKSAFQGRGYAAESCRTVMAALAERGVREFTAHTALANAPSCRLLERLGFKQAGTTQQAFYRDGQGRPLNFEAGIFHLASELTKN